MSSGAFYGTGYGPTPFGGSFPYGSSVAPGLYGASFQMGEQLSDQEIENLLDDALDLDPLTCNADVQVQCQSHVVTLTGTVVNRLVKIAAGNDAWIIPGVRDVSNNIQIKTRSQHGQKQTQRQPVGAGTR
jgi:hypothetical protein